MSRVVHAEFNCAVLRTSSKVEPKSVQPRKNCVLLTVKRWNNRLQVQNKIMSVSMHAHAFKFELPFYRVKLLAAWIRIINYHLIFFTAAYLSFPMSSPTFATTCVSISKESNFVHAN